MYFSSKEKKSVCQYNFFCVHFFYQWKKLSSRISSSFLWPPVTLMTHFPCWIFYYIVDLAVLSYHVIIMIIVITECPLCTPELFFLDNVFLCSIIEHLHGLNDCGRGGLFLLRSTCFRNPHWKKIWDGGCWATKIVTVVVGGGAAVCIWDGMTLWWWDHCYYYYCYYFCQKRRWNEWHNIRHPIVFSALNGPTKKNDDDGEFIKYHIFSLLVHSIILSTYFQERAIRAEKISARDNEAIFIMCAYQKEMFLMAVNVDCWQWLFQHYRCNQSKDCSERKEIGRDMTHELVKECAVYLLAQIYRAVWMEIISKIIMFSKDDITFFT